jgi:hypothetical protein
MIFQEIDITLSQQLTAQDEDAIEEEYAILEKEVRSKREKTRVYFSSYTTSTNKGLEGKLPAVPTEALPEVKATEEGILVSFFFSSRCCFSEFYISLPTAKAEPAKKKAKSSAQEQAVLA